MPELLCGDSTVQEPAQILNFLRKQVRVCWCCSLSITWVLCLQTCVIEWVDFFIFQRFNADYELTARQGADTMAYIALLEEKLRPALVRIYPTPPGKHWSVRTVSNQWGLLSHSYTLSGWMQKTTPIWHGHGLRHARLSLSTFSYLVTMPTVPSPASF